MPDEDDALTGKLLLRYAGNRSKAKSWLTAALGQASEEVEAATDTQVVEEEWPLGDDENSGIGTVKRPADADDDLNERKTLSANDALRKRLLSGDALKRYNEKGQASFNASKPMPKSSKSRRADVSDDDDERKGKSKATRMKGAAPEVHGEQKGVSSELIAPVQKVRKRPGNYLDEVLAGRRNKQFKKKTSAKNVDND